MEPANQNNQVELMKTTTSKKRNLSFMKFGPLITQLMVCVSLFAASGALGTSYTWINDAGTGILNTATNWSPSGPPSVAFDVAAFDNTTNLGTLTWNAAFGPTSGNAGGVNINYTGTNNLALNESTTASFGLGNVTVAAGAGVFTLGDGAGTANMTIRSPAMTFSNASANLATIKSDVVFGNGGGVGSRNITFNGTGNWIVGGSVYSSGFGSQLYSAILTKDGSGTLTLGGTNLHGGGTSIILGTLLVTNGSALGTNNVTIAGGGFTKQLAVAGGMVVSGPGNFNIAGRNFGASSDLNTEAALVSQSGNNTLNGAVNFAATGGSWINLFSAGGTLTLNGPITGTLTGNRFFNFTGSGNILVNGNVTNGSVILGLRKGGAGTLTLAGTNNYSGNTTVDAGTLLVDGDNSAATGAVTNNGTLGGTGTIGGLATVNSSGLLFAGNGGMGTLTFSNNLTLNPASTNCFVATTGGVVSNHVVVAGQLSPNGSVVEISTAGTQLGAGIYTNLFTYGTTNGTVFAATPVFDTVQTGTTASIQDDGSGHINLIVNTAYSASTNAYLTGITLSPVQSFSPSFVSNVLSGYVATENYGVPFTVIVTNGNGNATNVLTYNSGSPVLLTNGVASGALGLNINPAVTNTLSVLVTAPDGITMQTYAVNVVEIPSQTAFKLTNSVSGGTNLVITWPLDHTGYRLLTQTNNLQKGVSGNTNDWGAPADYTMTNTATISITKTNLNAYYRLVYP